LLFDNFFPIVDTCLSCDDIVRESCAMVRVKKKEETTAAKYNGLPYLATVKR